MTTIAENRIKDALDKACHVGFVEEPFTVMGCHVVMRNLRPEEYGDIMRETEGLKDVEFAYSFQMGHVCRSIIEVGDLDLRDVEFVETEVPDPKNPGQKKVISLERHDWMRKKVLATWGKEALSTLYRKFADVLQKADDMSVEGVKFIVPDETAEDKFRRLLGEMKEVEESLPDELIEKILADNGYAHQITPEELAAAQAKLGGGELKRESEEALAAVEAAATTQPTAVHPVVAEAFKTAEGRAALAEAVGPASPDLPGSETPRPDPRELMRRRTPLNVAADAPPAGAPAQVLSTKGREYADLEAMAARMNGMDPLALPSAASQKREIPELSQPMDRTPSKLVIDAPPPGGINPRFKPPTRL